MSTVISCYPQELHQGHYVFAVGSIRIPVDVTRNGEHLSQVVSGHAVRFWVGVPAHCGGGSAAAGIWLSIGLIALALCVSAFRRWRRIDCDHPVHQPLPSQGRPLTGR